MKNTMKAVHLTGHGDMEMLDIRNDVTIPTPGVKEVLIKIGAAGVNNTDINTRIGWYSKSNNSKDDASWSGSSLKFPLIQGADVCGTIVAVGEQVDHVRIGERVLIEPCLTEANGEALAQPWYFGSECHGGFAEYTTVASQHAHKIESHLSDIELASFPCSYSTAENMLTRTQIKQGDRVLISGASGGVGSAAVQLAKARGAYVFAITSKNKQAQLIEIGADETLTRDSDIIKELGHNSINVVIDLVGGDQWPKYLDVLMPKGRYAVSGAIAGSMVELDLRTLYLKDLNFFGCTIIEPDVFPNLIHHIEQGNISPLIAKIFPLEEIKTAQNQFLTKQHVGNIVLKIED